MIWHLKEYGMHKLSVRALWTVKQELYKNRRLYKNGRKIAMDKHQCTRTLPHENDPFGNIIENFANLFNLSADTKTSKTGITDEIKKEVGTTLLKIALYFRSQNCTSCKRKNKWRNRVFCQLLLKIHTPKTLILPKRSKKIIVFLHFKRKMDLIM